MHGQTLPLDQVWEGALVELVDIQASRKFSQRLADLGLLPRTRIAVLNCAHGQPIIIRVRGSKIAVDRRTAHQIQVRPIGHKPAFKHHRRAGRRSRKRRPRGGRNHCNSRGRWMRGLLNAFHTRIDEADTEE